MQPLIVECDVLESPKVSGDSAAFVARASDEMRHVLDLPTTALQLTPHRGARGEQSLRADWHDSFGQSYSVLFVVTGMASKIAGAGVLVRDMVDALLITRLIAQATSRSAKALI